MKKENNFLEIVLILVLIGIIVFPYLLAEKQTSEYIELFIENHEELPKISDSEFFFAFSIKNSYNKDINLNYIFGREVLGYKEVLDLNQVIILENEKKTFVYPINKTKSLTKYYVEIPQRGQVIHFWITPEIINYFPVDSGIPWDLQDPVVQSYYRYG